MELLQTNFCWSCTITDLLPWGQLINWLRGTFISNIGFCFGIIWQPLPPLCRGIQKKFGAEHFAPHYILVKPFTYKIIWNLLWKSLGFGRWNATGMLNSLNHRFTGADNWCECNGDCCDFPTKGWMSSDCHVHEWEFISCSEKHRKFRVWKIWMLAEVMKGWYLAKEVPKSNGKEHNKIMQGSFEKKMEVWLTVMDVEYFLLSFTFSFFLLFTMRNT